MKICAIMDIDGVYTNATEWEKHIPKENNRQGWDNYNKHLETSKPNKEMVEIAKALQKLMPILFVTSREDTGAMRNFTKHEIESYSDGEVKIDGKYNKLLMRKENDFRPSAEVKQDILNQYIFPQGYKPVIAIDDSKSNIEMFKKNGIGTKLYTIA